jgi:hypothetical protein
MTIHKPSLVLGASFVVACLVAVGAVQSTAAPSPAHAAVSYPTVQVAGIPTPGQMVVIREGTPFVVPEGRRFVLTALGSTQQTYGGRLYVNNVLEVNSILGGGTYPTASLFPTPVGFSVASGSTIRVEGAFVLTGRAWGYVAAP